MLIRSLGPAQVESEAPFVSLLWLFLPGQIQSLHDYGRPYYLSIRGSCIVGITAAPPAG